MTDRNRRRRDQQPCTGPPSGHGSRQTLAALFAHRRDVVTRRTRYELNQAEGQREIIEGLGMALTDIDVVIKDLASRPTSK